jgi:hypothetical protein
MQQRICLERLWFWSKEQGDRHIDCGKSVHRNGGQIISTMCSRDDIDVLSIHSQRRVESMHLEDHTCVCCAEHICHIQGCCGHNAAFPCDTEVCQQCSTAFGLLSQLCMIST